jgi:hypothetical protein
MEAPSRIGCWATVGDDAPNTRTMTMARPRCALCDLMVDIPSLQSFECWSAANMTRVIYRVFAAVNSLHHELEHGIQDLARLLGIAIGEQLHRALEVGEEHGDLLSLTLERAL